MARPFLKGSLKVARIFGIPVYLHFSFLILMGTLGVISALGGSSGASILHAMTFLALMFTCILAHEFGHILMARRFGIDTLDVTLLPIGGLARLKRMPEKPSQELLVALAGPAVNVVIAGALFGILTATGTFVATADVEILAESLPVQVMIANVSLVLFNLLPAFPMDGGRVLRALLAMKLSYVRATSIAARIGQVMAVLFGFGAYYSNNPMLILVALFVWFAAKQEAAQVLARVALEGVAVERMMLTDVRVLPASARLGDAVELLRHSSQRAIPVSDDAGFHGVAAGGAILDAAQKHGVDAPLEVALQRDALQIDASLGLNDALLRMQESGQSLAVVFKNGAFVGLLDGEHVMRALAVQKAAPSRTAESSGRSRDLNVRESEYIFPPLR